MTLHIGRIFLFIELLLLKLQFFYEDEVAIIFLMDFKYIWYIAVLKLTNCNENPSRCLYIDLLVFFNIFIIKNWILLEINMKKCFYIWYFLRSKWFLRSCTWINFWYYCNLIDKVIIWKKKQIKMQKINNKRSENE